MSSAEFQAEKALSDLQKALQATKDSAETQISKMKEEKEGAITAVKAEFMQSAKESGKQKVST